MYSLNGIDLADYGILVKNFTGFLDMPKRMGDTEQSWPDENGIEAFTNTDDIKFEGRNLTLTGYFECNGHIQMVSIVQNFFNDVDALTDLVDLVTPYGTYQVYLKSGAKCERIGNNFASLEIAFREPVANFTGTLGTGSGVVGYGVDNFDFWNDFAIRIMDVTGKYKLPKMKGYSNVEYEKEGYSITKVETKDLVVRGYCEDLTKIPDLYSVLASEEERTLKLKFDKERACYVKGGCSLVTLNKIKTYKDVLTTDLGDFILTDTGDTIGVSSFDSPFSRSGIITMNFRLISPFVKLDYLADEGGDLILTDDNFKIIIH